MNDILTELEARREHYSTLREEQKRADKYYELEFKAGIPGEYKQRTPPTSREWIAVGVRNYTLDNPLVRMFPRGNTKRDRELDSQVELLANFWMKKSRKQIKELCTKSLLRGEAFMKVGMDDTYFGMPDGLSKEAQKEYQSARLRHFPLKLTVLDPLNCYPSPAENDGIPVDIIEEMSITTAEAENLCKRNGWTAWTRDAGSTGTTSVSWKSYLSANRKVFFLDDTVVLDTANIFGFVPVYHVDGGLGQTSWQGDSKYLYRSILFPWIDSLRMESRAYSYADAILGRIAFDRHKLTGEDAEVERLYPDKKIPTDPDVAVRAIKDIVDVEVMKSGEVPNSVFEMLGMLGSKSSAPAALSGGAIPGVYSAQHREDIMATSLPIYKGTLKAVQDGMAVFVGMGLRIIDKVYKHPVLVRDMSDDDAKVAQVGSKQIKGCYDCEVQLLAEPPEATDMRKTLGSKLKAAGDISHRTALMKYHNMTAKETEDEITQIAAERALAAMGDAIGMDALHQLGLDQNLEEVQQQLKQPPRRRPSPENIETGYEGAAKQGRNTPQVGETTQPGVIAAGEEEM